MRMMLCITFPTAKFNELWRQGQVGQKIERIIADTKPEAIYFGKGTDGQRGAVVIVDIATPADLSRFTEPLYLTFEAAIETSICMTPEDVAKIDMNGLAKKHA